MEGTAMNRIVRRHVPASSLPADLREVLPDSALVTVVVVEEAASSADPIRSLEDILAARRPPYRSIEEIDGWVRQQRHEWNV